MPLAEEHFLAELRQPKGPPSGAPYPYRKVKETNRLVFFLWLTLLVVLLVGAYARRREDDDNGVVQGRIRPNPS